MRTGEVNGITMMINHQNEELICFLGLPPAIPIANLAKYGGLGRVRCKQQRSTLFMTLRSWSSEKRAGSCNCLDHATKAVTLWMSILYSLLLYVRILVSIYTSKWFLLQIFEN